MGSAARAHGSIFGEVYPDLGFSTALSPWHWSDSEDSRGSVAYGLYRDRISTCLLVMSGLQKIDRLRSHLDVI